LLTLRRDQLLFDTGGEYDLGDLVHMIVIQPGDGIAEVEASIGFPLFSEPAFEWVLDHHGWIEAITVLSDDGFGIAIFVPEAEGIDPTMLSALRNQAAWSNNAKT
jgi:hypothetical protein